MRGIRAGVAPHVAALHGDASCWNPGLRNEKSPEIILGLIEPAIPRTAALKGDRSARYESVDPPLCARDSGALLL
jgi:hypothetical protein